MSACPVSVKGVLIHDGCVLLLLNERGEWDLPGGRPDPGEDHRAALKREVGEETGLEVEVGTALDELERSGGRYGLVTMCAAGGMAPAIIIERI